MQHPRLGGDTDGLGGMQYWLCSTPHSKEWQNTQHPRRGGDTYGLGGVQQWPCSTPVRPHIPRSIKKCSTQDWVVTSTA